MPVIPLAPRLGMRSTALCLRLISQGTQDGGGEGSALTNGEEGARTAFVKHAHEGRQVAGNDPCPGSHRLDQHNSKALATRLRSNVKVD